MQIYARYSYVTMHVLHVINMERLALYALQDVIVSTVISHAMRTCTLGL